MKTAILLASLLAFANALDCDLDFSCRDNITALIYGNKFTCKNGLVCNGAKETSCEPCIKKPPSCPFKCQGDRVNFNGSVLACGEPFVCNQSPDDDCIPCVRPKCNPEIKQYSCDKYDDALVKIENFEVRCDKGYKCNLDYLQPCDPCISRDENLDQPFVQASKAISKNVRAVSKPAGILVPDEDMIDCNDGKSFHQPCRPGPDGANYYFKCTLSWNLRYSTSIKPCTSLYNDKLCRRVQDICLP